MFEKFTSPETFVDLVVDSNIERIRKIVESGYNVNKRTKYGAYLYFSGLTMAIRLHRNEIVKYLLDNKATVLPKELLYAIISDNKTALSLMHEYGVPLDRR